MHTNRVLSNSDFFEMIIRTLTMQIVDTWYVDKRTSSE